MRIAIELQACQGANKRQGIGRSSLEFTRALLRNHGGHEILVATNSNFPADADRIREALSDVASRDQFVSWRTHYPCDFRTTGGSIDLRNAMHARNQFFAGLGVDLVHTPSLFEGYGDSAATAIERSGNRQHIESVTLHDLIPMIHDSIYLADASVRQWYMSKLEEIKRADLLLAVSESSRQEGLRYLGFGEDAVVAMSSGVGPEFRPARLDAGTALKIKAKHGIRQRFAMYSGGIDVRKNIERLIQAYAALPRSVRHTCQLAVVCRVSDDDKARFTQLGAQHGLAPGDLVFTGYVTDADLVSLYSLCDVFVFPSWHEGFGLPVLEAMACGAPVITSDRSSLPEVMGRDDALFDPYSVESMEALLRRALEDHAFAESLSQHGIEQSARFSWDSTARKARAAFESVHKARTTTVASVHPVRRSLAYVSPLPPEQSGISDYSAELLPALSQHYDVVAITSEATQVRLEGADQVPVRSGAWFEDNVQNFDRIVYQFGNSTFHSHMFDLLGQHPGVVVLHDFYLSGIVAHLHHTGERRGMWPDYLYRSHGYKALMDLASQEDASKPIWAYPANLPVLQQSLGTIVHSNYSMRLADQWYGPRVAAQLKRIPQLRKAIAPIDAATRAEVRARLGIPRDALLVCSFGLLGPSKRNEMLVEAWAASGLAANEDARLVFVGEAPAGAYGLSIVDGVARLNGRASITGFVDTATYHDYLLAADVAVQLRSMSRGETSRAVLDCMAAGLPLLVNANGSMAELPEGTTLCMPDEFTVEDLSRGLLELGKLDLRKSMSRRQRSHVESALSPDVIAHAYAETIEAFYRDPVNRSLHVLAQQLAAEPGMAGTQDESTRLAESVAYNTPIAPAPAQLLVDVSELVKRDARSGIQRVVHGVLKALFERTDVHYRIEPVYTTGDGVYRYARRFTSGYLGLGIELSDEAVDYGTGDVFVALDVAPVEVRAAELAIQRMRQAGVRVFFIAYDVLPLQRPDCFPPEADSIFRPWTEAFGRCASGVICISRTVACDVYEAMDVLGPERYVDLPIWSFPLGLTLCEGAAAHGMEEDVDAALSVLGDGPIVMMVGTIEPRKGYAQALSAFEELWHAGSPAQLVIVGKQGWMTETIIRSIVEHPERGCRLHWFEGASDAVLDALYQRARALLCASEAEGFGLPLLEAFSRGLPVIARDIPVFREVGDERPTYFSGFGAGDLASAIQRHLDASPLERRSSPDGVPRTWDDAVEALLRIFDGAEPAALVWRPGGRCVVWAGDARMQLGVGVKRHGRVETTSTAGVLVKASDLRLTPGTYALTLDVDLRTAGEDARVEVVAGESRGVLLSQPLDSMPAGGVIGMFESEGGRIEVRIHVGLGDNLALRKIVLTDSLPSMVTDGQEAPIEGLKPIAAH